MKHIFHLGTLVVSTMFLVNCGDDAIASERSLAGKGEQLHQGLTISPKKWILIAIMYY